MKIKEGKYRSDSTIVLIKDIWQLLDGRKLRFFLATILELISNLAWLYPAYALAMIVNFLTGYTQGQSLTFVWTILFFWIIASILHYGLREIAFYIGFQLSERASLDFQLKTLDHMMMLDLSWHEKENSGNKLKRIQKGGNGIDMILRIWFNNLIQIAVNFVGMIYILVVFDLTVGFITLFFLISYFLCSYFLTKRAGNAAHIVNIREEELQGVTFETINNIRSVKVLGMHNGLLEIVSRHISDLFNKIRLRIKYFRLRAAILHFLAQTFRLGTTFFIVWGITNGQYQIGFLVLFITYFNYIWESIDRLSNVMLDFIVAKYGVSRMMDILNEPIKIDKKEGKLPFPKKWQKISVRNLTFSYKDKKPLFKNISFEIIRGEKVGIVGISGAGKSTLFKLLLKEHENYEGEILFDDIPLKDIKRTDYFKHSAVVLQDTEVFNFTLKDNITIGDVKKSWNRKLLKQAIETAHVAQFMDKMPKGLNTHIGEKGVKLSGGEKQRVGIARAIFKQPQVLFLDEATSHLDLESEEKIRDSLHHFFQKVTAIVIAHRLSTIKEMDRIIVIENGKIVEEGSFDNLQKKRGRFYKLWEKQKV